MNNLKPDITRKRKHRENDVDKEINNEKLTKLSNENEKNNTDQVGAENENAESEEENVSEEDDQDEVPISKPFHMKKFREKLREIGFINGKFIHLFKT